MTDEAAATTTTTTESTTRNAVYSGMITNSMEQHGIYRKSLTSLLYNNVWWICTTPCTCGGVGCVDACTKPMCLVNCKCSCVHGIFQSDEVWGDLGCFAELMKCLCVVWHCSLPPRGGPYRGTRGMPLCALAGFRCCEAEAWSCHCKEPLREDAEMLNEIFLCFYCWCFGCGLTQCSDPWMKTLSKCLCYRLHCYTEDACPIGRDCMFGHLKCCCAIAAATFPSCGGDQDGIPGLSCCNKILWGPPAPRSEIWNLVPPPKAPDMFWVSPPEEGGLIRYGPPKCGTALAYRPGCKPSPVTTMQGGEDGN